jgi:hypothetical protein
MGRETAASKEIVMIDRQPMGTPRTMGREINRLSGQKVKLRQLI